MRDLVRECVLVGRAEGAVLDDDLVDTVVAGYQQLVRGEPFRGKFRKSFERPVPVAIACRSVTESLSLDVAKTVSPAGMCPRTSLQLLAGARK